MFYDLIKVPGVTETFWYFLTLLNYTLAAPLTLCVTFYHSLVSSPEIIISRVKVRSILSERWENVPPLLGLLKAVAPALTTVAFRKCVIGIIKCSFIVE